LRALTRSLDTGAEMRRKPPAPGGRKKGGSSPASAGLLVSAVVAAVLGCVVYKKNAPDENEALGDDAAAVRPSMIANGGLGAFALQGFSKGKVVGHYHCALTTRERGLDSSLYSWVINSTHKCDAEAVRLRNSMRYVNSVASSSSSPALNVVMRIPRPSQITGSALPYVEYVASRRISIGE